MAAGSREEKQASVLELVRYADARDRCLMALGVLGSFGDGMMQPLSMLVLGDIVNSYGGVGTADTGFSSNAVDKVSSHPYIPCHITLPARAALSTNVAAVRASVAVRRGCRRRLRFPR
jgi:hypothetical protein